MQETYAPIILERKVRRLRKETGNPALRSKLGGQGDLRDEMKLAIVRPIKLLIKTPVVTLMAFYVAIVYGIMYLLISTFSYVYKRQYNFGEGTIGLAFLPAGIGMMIGVGSFGQLSDYIVKSNKAQGREHKPEIRLLPWASIPAGLAIAAGLFIYGWTTANAVHWIVPMIGVVVFSGGLMGVMVSSANVTLTARTAIITLFGEPTRLTKSHRCASKTIYSTHYRDTRPP